MNYREQRARRIKWRHAMETLVMHHDHQPVWDGNQISKEDWESLIFAGYLRRDEEGETILTIAGEHAVRRWRSVYRAFGVWQAIASRVSRAREASHE